MSGLIRTAPAGRITLGLVLAGVIALIAVGPARLIAQIEGDRGILPVASSSDIQVGGIAVETTGKTAQEARAAGWKLAAVKGWEKLKGPQMSESQLQAMVAAVIVEREEIGPHRYIATLGVVFDREKAGQFLPSASGDVTRSAPLLVLPVLYSGGTAQLFEVKGPWQQAWAEFHAGSSPVDYVRPIGSGGDSLILTAGQASRRSRLWWHNVLDQFGASDVIMPIARLERQWPGGPVKGTFTARYGPDDTWLDSFTLESKDEDGVTKMLADAVQRFDRIYSEALGRGLLRPDPTLTMDQASIDSAFATVLAQAQAQAQKAAQPDEAAPAPGSTPTTGATEAPATVSTITVQFASPDGQAVDTALGAVRSVSGVRGASTSSIAIGGTSVMRVSFAGDIDSLAAALRSRGWQVTVGNNALSIRR